VTNPVVFAISLCSWLLWIFCLTLWYDSISIEIQYPNYNQMTNINFMIHNLITFVYKIQGSSLTLPAHWAGGARARKIVIAAKNSVRTSEGAAEGGCGGNSAAPEQKIEASPAACSFRAEPSKILFSLIERIFQGRAQIQKCKEYFARRRASASGGGAASFVRVRLVKSSDFIQEGQQY